MSGDPKPDRLRGPLARIGVVTLAFAAFLGIGQALFVASHRTPPAPAAKGPAGASPAQVSAGGFSLASTRVEFPDDQPYPPGPGADVMNANCTACHSPSMALSQPALSKAQWTAEVDKMRTTYKAPVAEKDVPAIIAYLTALKPGSAAGQGGGKPAPAAGGASESSG